MTRKMGLIMLFAWLCIGASIVVTEVGGISLMWLRYLFLFASVALSLWWMYRKHTSDE